LTRRRLIPLALLVLALGTGYVSGRLQGDDGSVDGPALPGDARPTTVTRVVDGDTVVLAGPGKVRLIGVDTPEVYGGRECFGAEASDYAKGMLDGRRVSYTVGREARDRYGRLLAYVWLEDGRSFNALLVAGGYARTLTIRPNDIYERDFARLARSARERGRGLWGPCDQGAKSGIFCPATVDRPGERCLSDRQRHGPRRKERGREV
jgi:micrococcal nuclease